MPRPLASASFACLALCLSLAVARGQEKPADDPLASDLAEFQGKWTLVEINHTPVTERVEKTIDGERETTRIYDSSGKLLRAQTSEFRLSRAGDVRTYRWTNARVVEGAKAGEKIADGTGVYTFRDGKWIAVVGLEQNATHPVCTEVWARPKAK